jgi:hypothetical protein
MALCDNAFCTEEVADCGHIAMAGRKFCCLACTDDWRRQNDALIEAAAPFHVPAHESGARDFSAELADRRREK